MPTIQFILEATGLKASGLDAATELSSIKGWDSLALVRLSMGLEEHLSRELSIEELTSIANVSDVEKLLNPSSKK